MKRNILILLATGILLCGCSVTNGFLANRRNADSDHVTYLVLSSVGRYAGATVKEKDDTLFLENFVEFKADAGSDLPDGTVITATSGATFEGWVSYEGTGALTYYDKVPTENGKILYAYFSGDGSGSSSGGGNSSQTNTDELDSVTTKYALKNLDTGKFLCGLEDTDPNEGYDQAYAASVSFKSGVRFALCDTESDGQPTWVCNINPWSFNSNGASENVTTYLTVGDSYWTVVKDFTADVYAQFKYGSDRIYFGLK